MTENVRASVVIPTYQRCASLRRTLECLSRQTMPPRDYEVIVAIDGSDDGTKEMVEEFPASFRLRPIWQPNRGRAAARNAGIRLAEGSLIVFLDDDMEPVPGFLLAHCDAHPPGSRRAVVGAVPIPVDASSTELVRYRSVGMGVLLDRLAQPGYQVGFRDMYSGNLSLARDLVLEVGGFDESFKLYGHEDYEFALRLAKAGVDLGFSPQAMAHQRYDKDFAALAQDSVARGRTAVLFARKHPDVGSSPKLATYHEGSPTSRLARSLMLWLSSVIPSFPDWVVRSMGRLERLRPRRLHDHYTLALDYFFWLGARSALEGETRSAQARRMELARWVLVLFACFSIVRLLRPAARDFANLARTDEITRYEARFRAVRPLLPTYGQVGYVSDSVPRDSLGGLDAGRLAFKRYLLTQYALLPNIVLPGIHGPLTVANFDSATGIDTSAVKGLSVLRDFGNGVMLFRNAGE